MHDEHLGGSPAKLFLSPVSNPIPRRSAGNLDSVESVLGRLADTRMLAICAALQVAVDCSE